VNKKTEDGGQLILGTGHYALGAGDDGETRGHGEQSQRTDEGGMHKAQSR
jgi:hypothetical protein